MCLPLFVSEYAAEHFERSENFLTGATMRNLSGPITPWILLAFLLLSSSSIVRSAFALPTPGQDSPATRGGLEASAAAGDPGAQYKLAYSLLNDSSHPDPASALTWLRSAASQHFAPAQFLLGYLYEHGQGVPNDYGQAAENYRAAARQGHPAAENNLGGLYQYGRGVPKDMSLAFECYRAAALHGNPAGQYNLGSFYYLGTATPRNLTDAVEWFRASANQGFAVAEANLSYLYFKGIGVPVDYAEAARWARLAAEQGLPHAATNYAYLCEHGKGVSRDYEAAYLWYSRAVAAGDHSAVPRLKSLAHHLTREQIDQANSQLAADATHPQSPDVSGAATDLSLIENP